MTLAIWTLAGTYLALLLLLLLLHLKSPWPFAVKALAILLALPAVLATFLSLRASLGWPTDALPPARFQLHAALVEEPDRERARAGRIFLCISPGAPEERDPATSVLPRALELPYSRALHQEVEDVMAELSQGNRIAGRTSEGSSWQRRFGAFGDRIELYTPPAPEPAPKQG
jgi:hypothetical protein